MGKCDASALQRNVRARPQDRDHRHAGLVFEDGTRKPGALDAAQIEQLLAQRAPRAAAPGIARRLHSCRADRLRRTQSPVLPRNTRYEKTV